MLRNVITVVLVAAGAPVWADPVMLEVDPTYPSAASGYDAPEQAPRFGRG